MTGTMEYTACVLHDGWKIISQCPHHNQCVDKILSMPQCFDCIHMTNAGISNGGGHGMPSCSIHGELPDLDLARQLVKTGEAETTELVFGPPPFTLSQLIRTACIPKEGHTFYVADFSAIEARVIAWLAGEKWRLDVFNTHGKIYEASAAQMFRVPIESIDKGSPLRQKGKVAELALGFGGGPKALLAMGALKMGIEEDELPGLDTLLIDWIGADDSEYTRAVTRKALVAAVARVRQPGVKFDFMLTLVGGQGIGKSALLKKLGGKWYSDSLTTVEGKEAYELLQGFWIMEMGELNATKRAEIEAIKLFLSKQVDVFRPAYGRRTQENPRQCVFIGSTNDRSFLKDRTGNRRYWPVPVGHVLPRRGSWTELQQDEIDQIWAEADQQYTAGEPLWLDTPELQEAALAHQEDVTEDTGREGIIREYLDQQLPEEWKDMDPSKRRAFLDGFAGEYGEGTIQRQRVCVAEIFAECFRQDICKARPMEIREVHEIMRNMKGWKSIGLQRFGKHYGHQKAYERC